MLSGDSLMDNLLVELDFLIALVRSEDRRHGEVVKILETHRGSLSLSPYSLVELDLLIWSDNFKVKEPARFFILLRDVVSYYDVNIVNPSAIHVAEAYRLRVDYKLTSFDSLHGATSMVEDLPLLSYDRSYEEIEGLKYVHPSDLT